MLSTQPYLDDQNRTPSSPLYRLTMRWLAPLALIFTLLLAGCAPPPTTAKGWMERAESLWDGNNFSNSYRAMEYLTEALKLNPKLSEAYYKRGIAHTDVGNHKEAVSDLNRALKLSAKNPRAYYLLGVNNQTLRNFKAALANYARALRKGYKPSTDARLRRAEVFMLQKDHAQAAREATKILATDKDNAPARAIKAYRQFLLGRTKPALEQLDQALEKAPEYLPAYYFRGMVHLKLKNYDQAANDLDDAAKWDPNSKDLFLRKAEAYVAMKEYSSAMEDYDQVIKLSPKNVTAFAMLGFINTKLGRVHFQNHDKIEEIEEFKKAQEQLQTALKLSAKNGLANFNLGYFYRAQNRYREAQPYLNKGLNGLKGKKPWMYHERGLNHFELKQFKLAIKDFRAATKLDAKYLEGFNAMGRAYLKLKQYKKAIQVANKVISALPVDKKPAFTKKEEEDKQVPPVYKRGFLNRGMANYELGRYKLALADMEMGLAYNTQSYDAYLSRGRLYAKLKLWEKAHHDLDKAIDMDPENATPRADLIPVMKALGDFRHKCELVREIKKFDVKKRYAKLVARENKACQ